MGVRRPCQRFPRVRKIGMLREERTWVFHVVSKWIVDAAGELTVRSEEARVLLVKLITVH